MKIKPYIFAGLIAMASVNVWADQLISRIPPAVKDQIILSLLKSNSPTTDDPKGGHHEEGGMWGTTTDGKLVILVAKSGPAHLTCSLTPTTLNIGDAIDPSLATNLASIEGEWHVHPSGTNTSDGRVCDFVQPPSEADKSVAFAPINLVIGARYKKVYFYDHAGVVGTLKLKELK